jgi:hypothetical protein
MTIDTALFVFGLALAISALVLIFRRISQNQALVVLILGVACSVAGAGYLPDFKGAGIEAKIDKKVFDAKGDIAAAIAPINLTVGQLKTELAQVEQSSKTLSDRVNTLHGPSISPSAPSAAPPAPPDNTKTAENGKYVVLIFYRDGRQDDATKLASKLTASGFQVSAINSALSELQIDPQPRGSTFIQPNEKSVAAAERVDEIAKSLLPTSAMSVGTVFNLRRGDIQIYMF